jgi:hypothetical protein
MQRLMIALIPLVLALPGCSKSEQSADSTAAMADPSVPERAADAGSAPAKPGESQGGAIPVSLPKIAYVYEYGYRLSAARIPELQRRHADLCEKQGPTVCRILDMSQSGAEGDYASGSLKLAVAASRARRFGAELDKLADESDGEEVSSGITGEDLSKQIVDTQARLRARTLLRDRLMEILATRKGSVAELVEAERAVAQVNEEIDEATSWLAEMQGRVDFSRMEVSYTSGSPVGGGFMEPIRSAFGSIGTILGLLIATLIVALTVLIPLGVVFLGLRAVWRRVRRKPAAVAEETAG